MDRRPDLAPLHGRFAWTVVAGDEQDEAISSIFRPLERNVYGPPGAVEAMAVEINHTVRLKRP